MSVMEAQLDDVVTAQIDVRTDGVLYEITTISEDRSDRAGVGSWKAGKNGDIMEYRDRKLKRRDMLMAAGAWAVWDSRGLFGAALGAGPQGIPMLAHRIAADGGGSVQNHVNTRDRRNADNPSMFDYVPAGQHAAILAGKSDYDATADFHTAFAEINGTGLTLLVPGAKYRVGELTIDGRDFKISSKGVWLHQWDGLLVDNHAHPIITVPDTASNIDIGSWRLKGNIDRDALDLPVGVDGYMHGIAVMSAKDIVIGDVYGEDILGDVLYTYGRSTNEAEMVRNLRLGVVSGRNIYRCIVALVGAEARIEGIIQKGAVGFRDLDVEPNDAAGTYQAVEADIGFLVGSQVSVISADSGVINKSVGIGRLDLDGSRLANSSVPYPSHQGSGAIALALRNCDMLSIGEMRLRNYASFPVHMTSKWRELSIGSLDFAECGAVDRVFKAIFVQRDLDDGNHELSPPEGAVLRIGKVTGELKSSDGDIRGGSAGRRLVASYGGKITVEIGSAKIKNGMIATGVKGRINVGGEWDFGDGYGEVAIDNSSDLVISGMKIANAATTYGLYNCAGVTFINCEGSFGSGFDYTNLSTDIVSIGRAITGATGIAIKSGEISLNGTKVPSVQGAAIAYAAATVPIKA